MAAAPVSSPALCDRTEKLALLRYPGLDEYQCALFTVLETVRGKDLNPEADLNHLPSLLPERFADDPQTPVSGTGGLVLQTPFAVAVRRCPDVRKGMRGKQRSQSRNRSGELVRAAHELVRGRGGGS